MLPIGGKLDEIVPHLSRRILGRDHLLGVDLVPAVLKSSITGVICTFVALALVAAPAFASSVDLRCARPPEPARAELLARARLLLFSAGLDAARLTIDCDAAAASLVWMDGKKTLIDETSGIVEGALDAIENRIAQARKPAAVPAVVVVRANPAPAPRAHATETDVAEGSPPRRSERELEGGVALATAIEVGSGFVSMGPRLDVGLGIGKKFAVLVGEGARFGLGPGDSVQVMVFDVQAGVAFGAPYQDRTALGAVLLGGAERLAVSAGRFNDSGVWAWSAFASLGLRGSVAIGPIDGWVGIDAMVRSSTIETGGPAPVAIPSLSGLVSVGAFLPAFSNASWPAPTVLSPTSRKGPE